MGGAFFFFLHCSSHQKKVPTRSEASKEFLKSIFASSGRRGDPKELQPRTRRGARGLRAPWRARHRRCRSRCCRRRWRAPTAPAPSPTGSPPTTRARPRPSRSSGSTSSSNLSRPSSKPPALDSIRSPSPFSCRGGSGSPPSPPMALAGSARRTTPPCPTRRPRRRSSRRGVCAAFDFPLLCTGSVISTDYCSCCSFIPLSCLFCLAGMLVQEGIAS